MSQINTFVTEIICVRDFSTFTISLIFTAELLLISFWIEPFCSFRIKAVGLENGGDAAVQAEAV